MKTYLGQRTMDGPQVTVDGTPLDPRFDLKTLSEEGFEWTYEGEAPAQLALAILVDHFQDDHKALEHYDSFMRKAVANFNNDWEMTSQDIDNLLAG